jgi:hypothetical protein
MGRVLAGAVVCAGIVFVAAWRISPEALVGPKVARVLARDKSCSPDSMVTPDSTPIAPAPPSVVGGLDATELTAPGDDRSSQRKSIHADEGLTLEPAQSLPTSNVSAALARMDALITADLAAYERLSNRSTRDLVADLRDDHVKWNAISAVRELEKRGSAVATWLQPALLSKDSQQRHLAAYLLGEFGDVPGTPLLAELLVENLAEWDETFNWRLDGRLETSFSNDTFIWHRRAALERLQSDEELYRLAQPSLLACVDSTDIGLRQFACVVLARHRCSERLESIVAVLVWHLRNNDIRGDAARSMKALNACGAMAGPWLAAATPGTDVQQQALLGHLLAKVFPYHPAARALSLAEFRKLGFERGDPIQYAGW